MTKCCGTTLQTWTEWATQRRRVPGGYRFFGCPSLEGVHNLVDLSTAPSVRCSPVATDSTIAEGEHSERKVTVGDGSTIIVRSDFGTFCGVSFRLTVRPAVAPAEDSSTAAMFVGRNLLISALPEAIAAVLPARAQREELTMQAALSGIRAVAVQAMALDPLVPDTATAIAILDEAILAHVPALARFAA